MRTPKALPALLLIAAASPNGSRGHDRLMNEIERKVVLPKGARPLSAYGRNYAFSGRDKVVATYLTPSSPIGAGEGCDVALKDLKFRPCTKAEVREMKETNARGIAEETPAGKRRWYGDAMRLPFISDGGCAQINVGYSISRRRILFVTCNGIA